MLKIDSSMITDKLNINLNHHLVKQKWRSFTSEWHKAIKAEVKKLFKAKFIRSMDYLILLSNVVLVKKANEQWQVYVDFMDLDKAYPKDCFLLPRNDQLVDVTITHQLLSFMDTYLGYNQIKMHQLNQEHTLFITNYNLNYYMVMPFSQKNA